MTSFFKLASKRVINLTIQKCVSSKKSLEDTVLVPHQASKPAKKKLTEQRNNLLLVRIELTDFI